MAKIGCARVSTTDQIYLLESLRVETAPNCPWMPLKIGADGLGLRSGW